RGRGRPGVTVPVRAVVGRGLAIAAVCVLLGAGGVLDTTHAVLLGCAGFAAVVLRAGSTEVSQEEWPERPHASRAGGRSGVSDLGWQVFGQDRRVRSHVVRRVRDLAAARIGLAGADPEDPAEASRLLGENTAAGLASGQPPTARTLQAWLDAVDRLTDERTSQ
ncbi:hypothetical protein, partial [Propionicimonas sp.]|uniref:hypothetical protein n=1 Tax=Propionicimonas sp. TaxID=1955623 RepID=UPI0039E2F783